ncbi:hypothetical protein GCM10022381_29970 [Leifsonia kafniensis]|uniref:Uncharacterized protein n=1 Tax=Leifsonia kafniensis TaxID=475957 RepID=A0ABP7KRW7_9MICO
MRTRVRVADPALIMYTSGTTSNPKGCVISHEAIVRGSTARIGDALPDDHGDDRHIMWVPLPLFHIAALQVFVFGVSAGASIITDIYLDADRALESIRKWRANSLWSGFMPPMRALRTATGFDAAELDWVRSIWTVGPEIEMRELLELFPNAALVSGGGMSETTGWFCISTKDDSGEMRATTSGKLVAGAEVRVTDPDTGADLPDGQRGELLVRTYTVMDGYFKDPERTAEAIDADGWVHTGDLYTHLASGHMVYNGRVKDMLKVGGENVPAIEIEAFLCRHPNVVTAEIVGVPDDQLDEVPVAFVELVPGTSVDASDLISFCRGELSTFKIPRAVYFMKSDEWPMSATKVNKRDLREKAIGLAAVPTG